MKSAALKDVAVGLDAVRLSSAAVGVFSQLRLEQLYPSFSNPRRKMDDASLDELAQSMLAHGIHSPLLVRPKPGVEDEDKFEIVAGHRRYFAASRANLSVVPCVVRQLTDDQAAEVALIDNLQRVDIPPMEEAEAFGELLNRPGATIESVAAALGKSASYVGRRLKLLDAIEPVREALGLGAIEPGHALELARLSKPQQEKLLGWLDVGFSIPDPDEDEGGRPAHQMVTGECTYCGDGEEQFAEDGDGRTWMNAEQTVCSEADCVREARARGVLKGMSPTRTSIAELRSYIGRTELRVLRDVPFPLDDELPPMACTACPKRAAGAASLFADIAEDTCTDPECLSAKLQFWVKTQLEAAARDKRELVMLYDGYVKGKGVAKWDCVVGSGCASSEVAIWVNGARIGHIIQICRDAKCAEHGKGAQAAAGSSGSKGGMAKPAASKQSAEDKRRAEAEKAERAKLAEKITKEKAYRERVFAALAAAMVPSQEAADKLVREACFCVVNQAGREPHLAAALGWPIEEFEYGRIPDLAARVRKLDVRSCLHAAALALCVIDVHATEYTVSQGRKPERLEQMAALLGVDVAGLRDGAKASKPAGAKVIKPVAKKAAPVKKVVLSAAARKRIADAQQKRWKAAAAKKKGGRK